MQFQSMWEMVWAAQGIERVLRDTPKLVVEQSQATGASLSFIAYKIVNNLHVLSSKFGVGVTINTPLGENMNIVDIYRGVKTIYWGVRIEGRSFAIRVI